MRSKFKILLILSFSTAVSEASINHAHKIGHKTIKYSDGSIKKGGHRNWRNNNPGNLEYGKFAIEHGAIGTDGRFAIFPSMKVGYLAQVSLLTSKKYRNKNIRQAIYKYAPRHENNTRRYVSVITKKLKISSKKRIRDLSTNQLLKMVRAMSFHEGMRKGLYIKGKKKFFGLLR